MSRLKSSLTSIPIEVPPIIQQNMDPGLNMERAASLMGRKYFNLYNMESDLHKFIQSRKADVTSKKDTDTEAKILEMLENNKKDFTTLKTWYQQARNNNQTKSKDYLNGIFFLHKNVQRNVQELDNNYQFLINQRSGVAFVGRHLSKSNHPLVDLAQKHITRLESIYQENLRVLSTDRPIYSDVNISANALWEEYHRVRIQLKQIRKRLWEVELSEERIADLDDWRQDDGQTKAADAAHKELLVAIDSVQSKIDGFTKADMERNWSAVERDLQTLQGLKVQGIINWLKSSSYLPEWMHEDLRNYWWKLSAKDDSIDLSLDVLYSQIRSCIAKVKYSTMENERHRKELNIYSSFGPRLREQSRCRLQDLIKKGETKVEEIEQAVQIYVEVMHSGQEYERNAAQLLDRMRADKRTIVGKIQPSIFMACRQVRYEGVEMLRYDEDLIVDDE